MVYLKPANELVVALVDTRSLAVRAASGDSNARADLKRAVARVNAKTAAVDRAEDATGGRARDRRSSGASSSSTIAGRDARRRTARRRRPSTPTSPPSTARSG